MVGRCSLELPFALCLLRWSESTASKIRRMVLLNMKAMQIPNYILMHYKNTTDEGLVDGIKIEITFRLL